MAMTAETVAFRFISLPSRSDRRKAFHVEFSDEARFLMTPGIRHRTPHVGCGLAHVAAACDGLDDPAVVATCTLEDDARLRKDLGVSWTNVLEALQEALAPEHISQWDVLALSVKTTPSEPLPESVRFATASQSFLTCSSTAGLHGGTALVWARSALPLLKAYETELLSRGEAVPIDRVLFAQQWNAWGPVSDFRAAYDGDLGMEGDPRPIAPALAPRVWISTRNLFHQAEGDASDNTGNINLDSRAMDDKVLGTLVRKAKAQLSR